jgi:hypothetical protein
MEVVEFWFERTSSTMTCREEEHAEAVMKLAAERFPETHRAGAKARIRLLRGMAIPLITEKSVAMLDYEDAIKTRRPEGEIEDLRLKFEGLQARVDSIKAECQRVETLARVATARWIAENGPDPDRGPRV